MNLHKTKIPPSDKEKKPTIDSRSSETYSKRPIKVAWVESQPKVRESWIKLTSLFPEFVLFLRLCLRRRGLERYSVGATGSGAHGYFPATEVWN
ncbi:MAG: hypothetical protein JWR69_1966 [Pedosphaera sp.]|nr:hypothetical protein [Pedosphaera sp.]